MDFTKAETCKFISDNAIELMRMAQNYEGLDLVRYLLSLVVEATDEVVRGGPRFKSRS